MIMLGYLIGSASEVSLPSVPAPCQGHAWLKDDEATHCKQCQKEFSISRRKVKRSFHYGAMSLCTSVKLLSWIDQELSSCLRGSTTVETAATSTATAAQATNWPCPPTPDQCECATCATHSCCREARPRRPDKATQHCTHSPSSLFFWN